MAEQLALQQGLGQGGAAFSQERAPGARAVSMEGPGDQLLAGAGLAGDQDPHIVPRQTPDLLADLPQGALPAVDDAVQCPTGALGDRSPPLGQAQRGAHVYPQALPAPGLRHQQIHSPVPRAFQETLGLRTWAEQDANRPRIVMGQIPEEAYPVTVRKLVGAQDHLEMAIPDGPAGTPDRGNRPQPGQPLQSFRESHPLLSIWAHHQHTRHMGHWPTSIRSSSS